MLNSAFAKDREMGYLCNSRRWPEPLVAAVENVSAIARYRQSLRVGLLGNSSQAEQVNLASNGIKQYKDGFYSHLSIQDNQKESDIDLQRFLAKQREEPEEFIPLKEKVWPEMLKEGGVIDQWARYFSDRNILPVLFALPTNPVMIDAKNRRADYQRNSELTAAWAKSQSSPAVFIDLGIKDSYHPTQDYADYRHLSEQGALRFSRELGDAIAQQPQVIKALTNKSVGASAPLFRLSPS